MAQIKVYYEPEMELLTVFWQAPRKNRICTELIFTFGEEFRPRALH